MLTINLLQIKNIIVATYTLVVYYNIKIYIFYLELIINLNAKFKFDFDNTN